MNYTLKVLLPEFIARMVMGIYKSTKEDALKEIKKIGIMLSNMHYSI